VDLRQLRERQELDNRPGTTPAVVAVPGVCTVARPSRGTCGREPGVGSVNFSASTSYRRIAAAKGTMITAEKRDLDVAMTASDDDRKRVEQSYLRYVGSGVEFFVTIIVLTLLGLWLDGRFGTAPVLTIVFTFFGFAAATWNLIRSVLPPSPPPHDRDEKS